MSDTPEPVEPCDAEVPADLLELYEVLEWEKAVAEEGGDDGG